MGAICTLSAVIFRYFLALRFRHTKSMHDTNTENELVVARASVVHHHFSVIGSWGELHYSYGYFCAHCESRKKLCMFEISNSYERRSSKTSYQCQIHAELTFKVTGPTVTELKKLTSSNLCYSCLYHREFILSFSTFHLKEIYIR